MTKVNSKQLLQDIKSTLIRCLDNLRQGKVLTTQNLDDLQACQHQADLIHSNMQQRYIFKNTKTTKQLTETVKSTIATIQSLNRSMLGNAALQPLIDNLGKEHNDDDFLANIQIIAQGIADANEKESKRQKNYKAQILNPVNALDSLLGKSYDPAVFKSIEDSLKVASLAAKCFQVLNQQQQHARILQILTMADYAKQNIPNLLLFLDQMQIDVSAFMVKFVETNPQAGPELLTSLRPLTKLQTVLDLAKIYLGSAQPNKSEAKKWLDYILTQIQRPYSQEDYNGYGVSTHRTELPAELRIPYGEAAVLRFLLDPKNNDLSELYGFTGVLTVKLLSDPRLREYLNLDEILTNYYQDPISTIIHSTVQSILAQESNLAEKIQSFFTAYSAFDQEQQQDYLDYVKSQLKQPLDTEFKQDLANMPINLLEFAFKIFPNSLDIKFMLAKFLCRQVEEGAELQVKEKVSILQNYLATLHELQQNGFEPSPNDEKYFTTVKDRVEYLLKNTIHLHNEDVKIIDAIAEVTEPSLQILFGDKLEEIVQFIETDPGIVQDFIDEKISNPSDATEFVNELYTNLTDKNAKQLTINPNGFLEDPINLEIINGPIVFRNGRLYNLAHLQPFWEVRNGPFWNNQGSNSLVKDPVDNAEVLRGEFKNAKWTTQFLKYVGEQLDMKKSRKLRGA